MVQTITTATEAVKTSIKEQSGLSKNCEARANQLSLTFQSFNDFAIRNNPDTQVLFGSDERKAIMEDYSTLEQLDFAFGEGAASSWLVIAIADLNVFSGSKKMDNAQMKSLAGLIALRYKHLKYSVLQLFFYKLKSGDFGKFYGKIDPMVVTCALKDFMNYVDTKTSEFLVESWQQLYDEYDRQVVRHRERWYNFCENLIHTSVTDEQKQLYSGLKCVSFDYKQQVLTLEVTKDEFELLENKHYEHFSKHFMHSFTDVKLQYSLCAAHQRNSGISTAGVVLPKVNV